MRITKIEKITYDTPKQFYDVVNAYPYNNFLTLPKSFVQKIILSFNFNIMDLLPQ